MISRSRLLRSCKSNKSLQNRILNESFKVLFSTAAGTGEPMRVAIIGGGASGLSSALHLAPLVKAGKISGPIDVYDASPNTGRDIGVGIWSTALDPFRESKEESHQLVYEDMLKHSSFVRDVGYRTPKGHWLATSRLDGTMPDLLFLREKDMLGALRKAVHLEEQKGSIRLHGKETISSIFEESKQPWSAPLIMEKGDQKSVQTDRDYHLIVAADGMNSVLRRMYGGYICARGSLTDSGSPLDLTPNEGSTPTSNWYVTGQAEATGIQDRGYTVFRGNTPLSMDEVGMEKSFQTWGEGKNMRFATVPMPHFNDGIRQDGQVWFITTDDDEIRKESDPAKRKEKLLETFQDWHDPICTLVRSTPPEEILAERAVAHKHSMSPVANFNGVLSMVRNTSPPSLGNGPAVVFVGDAFMTIDPILAQGFTIGMEGASALRASLELSFSDEPRYGLAFDPYRLREELKNRHNNRITRLIHLLRATELVQALGQPKGGTISGMLSRDILRPLMRLTPDFIKTPIFNFMLKYSLGNPQDPSVPGYSQATSNVDAPKAQNS